MLQSLGNTGAVSTLQRNITIYVLVAGIAGGLLLILVVLLLCKYCPIRTPDVIHRVLEATNK